MSKEANKLVSSKDLMQAKMEREQREDEPVASQGQNNSTLAISDGIGR